jgi:hypothetical protein
MKQILKYSSILLVVIGISILISAFIFWKKELTFLSPIPKSTIVIRSIDTMKYSRDLARQEAGNPPFDLVIQKQVFDIAQTGANYIAIGTPYDQEFAPFLNRWVLAARANHLKVWFRGNLSGWEQWFNYPEIDRQTHTKMIGEFIKQNPGLFQDGDIFTPCSECENGGPGDPRKTDNVQAYRTFLIDEYNVSTEAFKSINKKVNTGYFSMNYDVARLIMDRKTTKALGGAVVIDDYAFSPTKLISDAESLSQASGGKIIFGEIGAPIPDLNGQMTEDQQANWINQALSGIFNSNDGVIGVNYWVNVGGSTQLWVAEGNPKKAVGVIKNFYSLE